MRVYCDGIFDLFHKGHLEHFRKITTIFEHSVDIVVGVISDKVATEYKRAPIFNETQRLTIIDSCVYVKECFITDTLILDEKFMFDHNIDIVVHAFANAEDIEAQRIFFKVPIEVGKFKEIEYTKGISTTEILNNKDLDWSEIWEKKGEIDSNDLFLLNGWESTEFKPIEFISNIIEKLNISENEKIIEIGCGAGLLAYYLSKYNYMGIDSSLSLINKHINILHNIALHFKSTDRIFKDEYFDYTIINGVFEYFDNTEEVLNTLDEINRITKKGIYIGNIRYKTRTIKQEKHKYDGVFTHLVLSKQLFIERGYTILDSLYDPENRFDVFIVK